jgi:hypothetical protein
MALVGARGLAVYDVNTGVHGRVLLKDCNIPV